MIGRRLSDNDAFTLVEVVIAAVILVIALTALATVFIGGQAESSADLEQSQIVSVADQQLELVRAQASAGNFNAIGISAYPSTFTTSTIGSTYKDPDAFAFTSTVGATTTDCYVISNNYDNASAASFASETPAAFNQWSDCSTYGEPLEILGTSALIQEGAVSTSGLATHACPSSGGGTIYSPCYVTEGNTQFNVYTFVTDTYVGCGTGSQATASGVACPTTNSSGVVQASSSSCALPTATTMGSTAPASTPCADARRVTVAVYSAQDINPSQGTQQPGFLTPVYLSAIVTNPEPSTTQESSVGLTLGGAL